MFRKIILSILFLAFVSPAFACPQIEGIPDFNCDGDLQIVVIGDSLVVGYGDAKYKGKGGYVLRAQKKLKKAAIQNLGKLGLRTAQLDEILKDAFDRDLNDKWKRVISNADIVILDLGRNDRWLFGEPEETFQRLINEANGIRAEVKKLQGIEPMVVIAVEMLPNRGSQGPWVKALNSLVLKSSTSSKPADLRFDTVSKRLLNFDQVHPTSKGYDELAKVFLKYLKGTLAKRMRALRPDADADGLPNIIETKVVGSDPNIADTDGDLKSDGDEYLTLHTNPLVAD